MKLILGLCLTSLLFIFQPLESFTEFLTVYSKRTTNIKKVLNEALNTGNKQWKEEGLAYPRDTYMDFMFIPESQDMKEWNNDFDLTSKEMFIYTEYDLKKDKKSIANLDFFAKERLENEENKFYSVEMQYLIKNGSEIQLEIYLKPKPQPYEIYRIENNIKTLSESKIRIPASKHKLYKAIQTGNEKFTVYAFVSKNRNLSQEEKDYWFQMFDYAKVNF